MAFDPTFDDTRWTWEWLKLPYVQIAPGRYRNGYIVRRELIQHAEICGRWYQLPRPLDCRGLYDPNGTLWMSDTPQERMMMFNNAMASSGRVLIGGLGLGLYAQYVAPRARAMTIVERSPEVVEIVWPQIEPAITKAMGGTRPSIVIADIGSFLAAPATRSYDTIFLDTWETLDATRLPKINHLRQLAMEHTSPGGRVLLWGYRWMVRMFLDACAALLHMPPAQRESRLQEQTRGRPDAYALLAPIVQRWSQDEPSDPAQALVWCERHILNVTSLSNHG